MMTPEQRAKHLKTIEKIENLPRPEKWRAIKDFLLELKPHLVGPDKDFAEACKELRQNTSSKTAASSGGSVRNTMKIPDYIYSALIKLDPELMTEMSGRNHGHQILIGKQLYKAFPEYRIARQF